eukprot:jgi/Botrbrau1/7876/Bobra.9_2s0052.1
MVGSQSKFATRAGPGAQRIFLARHGERVDYVDYHWVDTAERPDDPPLTERGLRQASQLGVRLRGEGVSHIYASPFLRTLQTAAAVASELGLPIRLHWGLAEGLFPHLFPRGSPQLMTAKEMQASFPQLLPSDPTLPPQALQYPETRLQCQQRSREVIEMIRRRHADEAVLVVTHGLPLKFMADTLVPEGYNIRSIPYCSLTECHGVPGLGFEFRHLLQDDFLDENQGATEAAEQAADWDGVQMACTSPGSNSHVTQQPPLVV